MDLCSEASYLPPVEFLVVGRDAAAFDDGDHELHERHQTYMDSWSARFVARGPVLSDDGSRHAGSVHIVRASDLPAARGFAFDEPYAQAGWYADITVAPYISCLRGTMWDRPSSGTDPSTLVRATWAPRPHEVGLVARLADLLAPQHPPWLFAGLVLDADGSGSVGFAAGVDLPQDDAADRASPVLAAAATWAFELSTDRWRRGGR